MEKTEKQRTIILSGGGTGGPVTPLLAVAEELLKEDAKLNLIFIDTESGPAQELVAKFSAGKIKFIALAGGKWRRYLSLKNILDIFKVISAFFKSLSILRREKPDLVISAGGFVSVPVVWAAAIRKIPILIHQQDIRPGLANKLMAPFARVITVSFEKSLVDYGPRAVLTGNPLKDVSGFASLSLETRRQYGFEIDRPLLMVIGGGTGAAAINELIAESLPGLLKICQVVHLTGRGKKIETKFEGRAYQSFEFLDQEEVLRLMAASDLLISRCGFGVLTELSSLAKAAILIPMPESHQEDNAALFKARSAGIVLNQNDLDSEKLIAEITSLLADDKLRASLSRNISKMMKPAGAENIAAIIWEILK